MAKAQTETSPTETAPAAADSSQGRAISLTLKAEYAAKVGVPEGSSMKRTDYIRKRWADKTSRGAIAKELSAIQGKAVPYQIVFQATKGLAGGPDKAVEGAAEGSAATGEGEAA